MSEYRKATTPLDPKAVESAKSSVAAESGGRQLTNGPEDAALRKKWMDAYIAAGGGYKVVKPSGKAPKDVKVKCPEKKPKVVCSVCSGPVQHSADLAVEKNLLTLKHDNQCKLEITASPAGTAVEAYKIEAKRASGGAWCALANSQTVNKWKATIAGKFKLRGVAKINGKDHVSAEKDLEVRFPSYGEITGNPDVQTAINNEWTTTLNDCTERPNRRRERGFWIRLNTKTDAYEHTATLSGDFVGPSDGASVPLPSRPADDPATPTPCDNGAVYSVASFHTHTPTVFRATTEPAGTTRSVGPSGADNDIDNTDDVPGVVYDYKESPAGSGDIPMGHPKNSAAKMYHSRGKDRRGIPA